MNFATRLLLIPLVGAGVFVQSAAANPLPPYPHEKVEMGKLLSHLHAEITARPDDPAAKFRYIRMRFHYLVTRNDYISVRKFPDPDAMLRSAADWHETVYDFRDIAERSLTPRISVEDLNELIRLSDEGLQALENPQVRLISGWCRMRIGKRDEAVLDFRKVFHSSSEDFLSKDNWPACRGRDETGGGPGYRCHTPGDEHTRAMALYAGKWLQELLDKKEDGAELLLIREKISEMMKHAVPVN